MARLAASWRPGFLARLLGGAWCLLCAAGQVCGEQSQGAVFLREFTLIRRESLHEDFLSDLSNTHKTEDSSSRRARSKEDRDGLWDAWGPWSECSRTCGGGASYSLRRCLGSRSCEGRNIRYRTCSNVDCPPDAGDFRAQQCSAHNDVKHRGQVYEWLPVSNDPDNPCALKCQAKGTALVVELAPKVLDGTRCYAESLDICISGLCQIVGCDHQLGSTAKEDNCGVCNGDGSTCRLVRGQYKSQLSATKSDDTVVAIPYGSRHVRLVLKGPDHLHLETKTLQGAKGENSLSSTGTFLVDNSSVDFQKYPDKETLRMTGPLTADFIVKIRNSGPADSTVQFIFYQPIIHRWRETDFFPCSATCGGGYQLTSAECYDLRSSRVVADQNCHYYPENAKPKPKLQECNLDPCPASDGYKQIMPYDLYHPLPRWEATPWTACSSSCGGGVQRRAVSCVEEDVQGRVSSVEEWKCMYTPKTPIVQPCNIFDCPKWLAQEWSPCTVTCGQGLRYRVVLCMDHRGMHTGGCSPKTKPHIKEECIGPTPCYRPREKLPVEAKLPWYKQAQELEEGAAVSEEPSFVPEAWSACTVTCGVGIQVRIVRCQVLLSFSQSVADLPADECEGPRPASQRACYAGPCSGEFPEFNTDDDTDGLLGGLQELDVLYDWAHEGFTKCSQSCGGGVQEAVVSCLNRETRERADPNLCTTSRRPPKHPKPCNLDPCPGRWEAGRWSPCSFTCGVGLQTRDVFCSHLLSRETNEMVILEDELCRGPKPSTVQVCNRSNCPPAWYPAQWQPCSRTCGGGVQKREVLCKQRMADGSFLELPDTICSASKPASQQECKMEDCPSEWLLSDWTECSSSCGEGTQTRSAVCRKVLESGVSAVVNSTLCPPLPFSSSVRPCMLAACARPGQPPPRHSPQIAAARKVYIQMRRQRRLHFVVGGVAYLLPKTAVVLRCHTRRSHKPLLTWEKDGQHLTSSAHVTVAPFGYLKIHRLRPADAGVYTCSAGPAREQFVIQLLGGNRKLVTRPPSLPGEEEAVPGRKASPKEALQTHGHPHGLFSNSSKVEKEALSADPSSRYDDLVSQLLEHGGWPEELLASWELQDFTERNVSSEEDPGAEQALLHLPFTLVAEQRRLDDILRNLSQQPEELRDLYSKHLVAQLAQDVFRGHPEHRDALHTPSEHRSPLAATPRKHVSGFSTSLRTSSRDAGSGPRRPHRKPTILRKISAAQQLSASEVVTHLGQTVVLASGTLSVLLNCEAIGNPRPAISWARNGEEIQFSNRILLQPDDSLQILAPVEADVGFYTCNATNAAGHDSVSIAVTLAGKPLMKTSRMTVVNTEKPTVTVDIGSTVKTVQGVNVTIHCQVAEYVVQQSRPQRQQQGAVLQAVRVTPRKRRGAASEACARPRLRRPGLPQPHSHPPQVPTQLGDIRALLAATGLNLPSVLTSPQGTQLVLDLGNSALLGCPVRGHPTPNVTWFHSGRPIGSATGLSYHILAAGQILHVANLSAGAHGEFSCLAQNEAGQLTQKASLVIRDYWWAVDRLVTCSASCGNRGVQQPRLRCLLNNTEVDPGHCSGKVRPTVQPVACNRRDCPSRWMVTSWSACTRSCGGGIQTRRVTCQKLKASGFSTPVPNDVCSQHAKRPVDTQACNQQLCVEWAFSSWGQCSGPCVGPHTAMQHRQVFCQTRDGITLPSEQCSALPRPVSSQNCWSEACSVHWRVSLWTVCTATCGSYGFQSRRVECVHAHTNKAVSEHLCSWGARPANWQRCNITPCENRECSDTSRYCEKVKQLHLCPLSQFKLRCCGTCGEA
ncbi:ADAMTS-like protein 1 [Octodon degus]|uniref:ADAMTS-like protein 1 n=1 Tax=Octodon degus TaxID=10160 RepID=A0A6P6EH24_OCTDE|nr:ADAMTS-like protein 1 [Octodon degus]